ncbi:MAG: hypothetical protein AAGB05_16290 [Pseudomonadota bacterium]
MKNLTILVTTLPSMAMAHGAHPPVADAAHSAAHTGIWTGLAMIVAAGVAAWAIRVRS